MTLAAVEPDLELVDRWLERRAASGPQLAAALEGLAARRLARWSEAAPADVVAKARAALFAQGFEGLASSLVARDVPTGEAGEGDPGPNAEVRMRPPPRASEVLARMTGATGSDAYEVVEQAFRRSLARLGARFVAKHARAAIDDDMGPMHATVVAAELLSMLERLDERYLEALTFALETMHDWAALAPAAPGKTPPNRVRKPRALSSSKRRA